MDKQYLKEWINNLKRNVNIVDVVRHYINLKRKGQSYVGLCPFHDDKTPSLYVNPQKGIFKCFACNTFGDMFAFVMKKEKVGFMEAVNIVAKISGQENTGILPISMVIKSDFNPKQKRILLANERLGKFYHDQLLLLKANAHALNYLKSRGLDEETIKKFKIGYAVNDKSRTIDFLTNRNNALLNLTPEQQFNEQELLDAGIATVNSKGEIVPFLIDRITFPIYDANNNLVAFSGRDLSGQSEVKYLHTKSTEVFNKSKILYNFNNVVKSTNLDHLIICEGFMDCIAYNRAGYANCVATMGTALTKEQIKLIKKIKSIKLVILSFDNDNAGLKANLSNAKLLMDEGFDVNIVNYSGMKEKDIDEIYQVYGQEKISELVNNAEDYCLTKIKNTKCSTCNDLALNMNELLEDINDYGNFLLVERYMNELSGVSGINPKSLDIKRMSLKEIDKAKQKCRDKNYGLVKKVDTLTKENQQLKEQLREAIDDASTVQNEELAKTWYLEEHEWYLPEEDEEEEKKEDYSVSMHFGKK